MSIRTTGAGKALIALTIAMAVMLSLTILPAMAEGMNESAPVKILVASEADGAINASRAEASMMTMPDDGILPFPRKNCTLFAECGYLIWEDSSIGSIHKLSVGLVPAGEEVISPNAIWVEVREVASSDDMGNYYTWSPPSEMEGYYNLLVLADHDVSGMRRGTNDQDTYRSDGPFYLEDPPAPDTVGISTE
jgi:hypothetical protein